MKRNRQREEKRDGKDAYERTAPRIWHGWVALVLLSLILIGLQSGLLGNPDSGWYFKIRLFLFPVIYLSVIVAAFREGYLPGILCLILPPYLLYYAVSRTDMYYIRGAFVAMLVSLACELHYDSERSFLAHVEITFNDVINSGSDAIHRAGNSGVEFVD